MAGMGYPPLLPIHQACNQDATDLLTRRLSAALSAPFETYRFVYLTALVFHLRDAALAHLSMINRFGICLYFFSTQHVPPIQNPLSICSGGIDGKIFPVPGVTLSLTQGRYTLLEFIKTPSRYRRARIMSYV